MVRKQENQSTDPKKYKIRILIAATNNCDDKNTLYDNLKNVVNTYDDDILFITRGVCDFEKWVKEWCVEFNYPFIEIPITEVDYDSIHKSMVLASEMIIYNKKLEYPYNLYMTLAKRSKIDISVINFGE